MTGLALFALAILVAAVAVMELVHYLSLRRIERRDEGRQTALYQQHKAAMQNVERTRRMAEQLAERTHAVHEETRLMQARVDGFFGDPRVKEWLDQGVSGRGG